MNLLSGLKREILRYLQEDGRISIVKLASKLGISHTGVRKHLLKHC